MIGVGVTAALIIGSERESGMWNTRAVKIGEASLTAIGARNPAKEMIERTVFHHDDDEVTNAGALRRGQSFVTACRFGGAGEQRRPGQTRCRSGRTANEFATCDSAVNGVQARIPLPAPQASLIGYFHRAY